MNSYMQSYASTDIIIADTQKTNDRMSLPITFVKTIARTPSFEIYRYFQRLPLGRELYDKLLKHPDVQNGYNEFQIEYNKELDKLRRKKKISVLKYYRLRKRISQMELAQLIGVRQHQISIWERMKSISGLKGKRIIEISEAIDAPIRELING